MKKQIKITIEYKDHTHIVLTNMKGDTFAFNASENEGFAHFLHEAKKRGGYVRANEKIYQPPIITK